MGHRSRKRSAWASVTEAQPGVWRIRFWAEGPDGYRRRSRTVRGSRLDAERVRSELMLAHSDDAPCPTVGQAWDRWAHADMVRRVDGGDMAASTLNMYEMAWGKHVRPTWADVPCDQVRPLAIQQWLTPMPLNAAKSGLMLLRQVLDYAVRYEVADHNPAREKYLMPSRQTVERHDNGVWSLSQLGDVWRIIRGQWFEGAFLLSAFGGMRVGEALGVRCEDVSVSDAGGVPVALVRVERQVDAIGAYTSTLKTPQSRRVVAIPGAAGMRTVSIADEAARDGRAGWLSGDGLGNPSKRMRLTDSWNRAVTGELWHPFRNLRNSWQTNMRWTLGVRPYYIEALMGHKVAGVTGEHYDRPSDEQMADVVARAWREWVEDGGVDPLS